jgi:zinc-ribbon domain
MFCSRCGKQIDDSLKFCNGCGTQIKKEDDSPLTALITALIIIGTAGLGILVGLSAVLLDKIPNFGPVLIFGVVYLGVLFGICFMIMRQITKLIDADLGRRRLPESEKPLVELPARSTNQLEEFREPASVTDQTTRTLDKIPR